MIELTALDVRRKKGGFRRNLRGYDAEEVDGFLEVVAARLEALARENSRLFERGQELSATVDAFRQREQAMNEALVSAQQLRDDIRSQAQREAELRIREATAEGERIITEARKEVARLREELQLLTTQRDRFFRSYRSFLESQLAEISIQEERVLRSRTGELESEIGGSDD